MQDIFVMHALEIPLSRKTSLPVNLKYYASAGLSLVSFNLEIIIQSDNQKRNVFDSLFLCVISTKECL